jgi:hypothetical protein
MRYRSRPDYARRTRNDELYIFTHPNMREEVDGRFAAIQAAMAKATAGS